MADYVTVQQRRAAPRPRSRATVAWTVEYVTQHMDWILHRYVDCGDSLQAIASFLDQEADHTIDSRMLRTAMVTDPRLAAAYASALIDRAHTIVEQSLEHANALAQRGELAKAAGIKLTIAAKLEPKIYGDKVTHQGDPDNPLVVESTVGVSDEVLRRIVAEHVTPDGKLRAEAEPEPAALPAPGSPAWH